MNRSERTTRTLAALLASFLACACQDFARPGLERCNSAEAAGKIEEAYVECEKAASLAPDSDSGKEAKAKADLLRPAVESKRADEGARKAEAARAATAKAAPAAPTLQPRPTGVRYPAIDDICGAEGLGALGYTFSGGTVGDVKEAYGCTHMTESSFCCFPSRVQ